VPVFRIARLGAVAQLGERRVRNAKVEGSIPFRSTISSVCRAGRVRDLHDASRLPRIGSGRDGGRANIGTRGLLLLAVDANRSSRAATMVGSI
jgi:hypothetical protein